MLLLIPGVEDALSRMPVASSADIEDRFYVAGTNKEAVESALKRYGDSTIGVMDNQGNILKPSNR